MAKYLVSITSFFELESTRDEVDQRMLEAIGGIPKKGERQLLRDLSISEVSVMPDDGNNE